ncbi:serine phosphatase RsbU (regulator of sigma subunit) [Granulicella aggregans]|uniref:Serine phosphatase RsbU (Regulator of sigma subunit) n=1 Tax=Granulicella aggregans TaxID=474949 RepID=A0A7W7ZF20_9BACT|nr:SpoIIE family protein phosphatase [Granulicella aggregans]MBB5058673.1 serine phosphatase RsbU (regulator of sigma subunit) [Granulicella aggregans]
MTPASRSSPQIVLHSEGTRRTVPVDHVPFTLGRGHDCHLTIGHPHVSREHAAIDRDSDGYFLRDTASRHGTFVNGVRVSTTRLRPGDRIALFPDAGERDMLLFEQAEEESSTRTLLAQITKSSGPGSGLGLDKTQVALAMGGQSELETLALFLKAAQSLNSYGAVNDVLRTMLEYTLRLTGAERGFVFLGATADTLRLESWQDKDGNATTASVPLAPIDGERSDRPAISYSIVREAAESHLDFILSNISPDAARGHESLILNAIRSVVAIPLRGQNSDRLLGVLYLDSRSITHDFTRTGKQILQALAHQAATLLENLRMIEAERESALLRKELEIAAAIQQQIIPQTLPEFPGVRLAARSVPCTGVGGDFYDVIPVEDGFVALVGDVCGKGVPAALLASMVQGMLHAQISAQATHVTSLANTVQTVNAFVCSRAPVEKYVTLAILRYTFPLLPGDPAQVELVNGGHVSPMIVRANGTVETIQDGDMPVGLLEIARFHAILITLDPGDRIVLLSDGISEAEDPSGTQFGAEEMTRYLASPDPVPSLFRAMNGFCKGAHPQDDQTVLTVDRIA